MTSSGDYQQAWQQYKQQGRLWIALFILYVPGVIGATILSARYLQSLKPAIAVAALWMAGTLYLGARLTLWRCPRCGQPYSGSLWRSKGIFAKQCAACGLPKYSNDEASLMASDSPINNPPPSL